MIEQFLGTGVGDEIDLDAVLAYGQDAAHRCCIFEGGLQPRLLDGDHFYYSAGIGKKSADPFLRFLVDVYCPSGPPNVREGLFLATWAIEHVIRTAPAGVAGPIRVATLERSPEGEFSTKELRDIEILEHLKIVEKACGVLRDWTGQILSDVEFEGVPPPPNIDDD